MAVPIAPWVEGACHRSASIETQRVWITSEEEIVRNEGVELFGKTYAS